MKGFFALVLVAVAGTAGAIDGPSTVPLEPDHCLGVIWSRRGVIDLAAMLDPVCAPYMADLYFEANGTRCENNRLVLSYWCPGSLEPDIYYVTLRQRNVSRPLDAMWIVANAPLALSRFNAWVSNNVSTAWTSALPKPFASIAVTNGVATDPEPPGPDGRPGTWDAPHRIDPTSYLHHNAVWEMRTTVKGEHGNQATYDGQGRIIRTTIAAGTADKRGPYNENGGLRISVGHRNEDVWPFILALQLDGNPVHIRGPVDIPKALTRPCLRQGAFTERYLSLRPTIRPQETP